VTGQTIRDERHRRGWPLRELARRAGISVAHVAAVESGQAASFETYVRVVHALGMKASLDITNPRRRADRPSQDFVHSAMGELELAVLRRSGVEFRLDHPFQRYHFAGRADLLGWDLAGRDLIHIENRTRFPDLQDAAGSYNAKREYLPGVLAERLGLRGGWRSVTHVMAALWSAEVLHVVRIRRHSLLSICPDPSDAFESWWSRSPPPSGVTSTFVLLDPRPDIGRARRFIDLGGAPTARPRYRGYADAARALQRVASTPP
jgi:transcriptional regulator with XRE-family HTH domain